VHRVRQPAEFCSPLLFHREGLTFIWTTLRPLLMPYNRTRRGPYRILSLPHWSSPPKVFFVGLEQWQAGLSSLCMINWEFATWMPSGKCSVLSFLCAIKKMWFDITKRTSPADRSRLGAAKSIRYHLRVIKMELTGYILVFLAMPLV
jgi:hypothetical protein